MGGLSVDDVIGGGLDELMAGAAGLHHERYSLYRDFYRGGDLPLGYLGRNPRESRKHWRERQGRLVGVNYCAPIVDKVVRAEYSRRVVRRVEDAESQSVLEGVVRSNGLDSFQLRTARQRAIDGVCVVQVYWDDAAGCVRLKHVLPEHFFPICLDDHERIDAVVVDRSGRGCEGLGDGGRLEVYTADEVGVFEGGVRVKGADEPWVREACYGVLPFVVFSGQRLVGDVFGYSLLRGVAELNHAVNQALNDVLEILHFQAFSLLVIQGALDGLPVDEDGRARLAISESGFLNVDETGRVYFADPNPKISEIMEVLDGLVRMMFETGCVPVAAARPQQSHAESAAARVVQFMPLIDMVTELQTFDRECEVELIEKVFRVAGVHMGRVFRLGRVDVRFGRCFLPTDEESRLRLNIAAMEAGLKTRDEVVMEMGEE